MKNILTLFVLIITVFTSKAQEYLSPPPSLAPPTKNEQLVKDAFSIFRANKYLDFKGRDSLAIAINDVFYSKVDLNNYFDQEKDWKNILAEDTTNYRHNIKSYKYSYTDSTMIEQNNYRGRNFKFFDREKIYNTKGFLLSETTKSGDSTKLKETRSIIYRYDKQNRATAIINTIINYEKKDTLVSKISAIYGDLDVTIKSNLETVFCKFIIDPNSVGFISKLNGKETGEYFMYGLADKEKRISQKYSTNAVATQLEQSDFVSKITALNSVRGGTTYRTAEEEHEEIWIITLANKAPEQYTVNFKIIKTPKGLKVNEFSYKKDND